jgi:tRNA/rRNA methyltransferase
MPLENIRVVLLRPQNAGNVGAAARALKNMGIRDLVAVAPACVLSGGEADVMAVHARDVLQAARTVPSLAAALDGCGLVVGTTCRSGAYRVAARSPRAAAPDIVRTAAANRVALVFGPEDHGLSNAEVGRCQQLLTIPTAAAYASLNLAQAVLLCCYELFLAAQTVCPSAPPRATVERIEFMFQRLQAALLSIGFLNPVNPEHIMFSLRRLLGQAVVDDRDVRIVLGMARQMEWCAEAARRQRATEPCERATPGE